MESFSREREKQASQQRQGELNLSLTRRTANEEIRSLFQTLLADTSQLAALNFAHDLAQKNYHEQSREYRLGLETNLNVLQALVNLQDSNRSLDRVKYAIRLDRVKLEVATARRPKTREDLE